MEHHLTHHSTYCLNWSLKSAHSVTASKICKNGKHTTPPHSCRAMLQGQLLWYWWWQGMVHDVTWQGMISHDKTWYHMTRHDITRQDKTWYCMTRHDITWQNMISHDKIWHHMHSGGLLRLIRASLLRGIKWLPKTIPVLQTVTRYEEQYKDEH